MDEYDQVASKHLDVEDCGDERLGNDTRRTSIAAVNEADDLEQRLILLYEPALEREDGDREATLRMVCVGRLSTRCRVCPW